MFETLYVEKNGKEIKEFAYRKLGILQTRIMNIEEQSQDVEKNASLSAEQKGEIKAMNSRTVLMMKNSCNFLEMIRDHMLDSATFKLSLMELNFLTNPDEYSYK